MTIKILSTLGPSSLNKETVQQLEKSGVHLFRVNLSHTKLDDLEEIIFKINSWSNTPICLDSEGAQVRNGFMKDNKVFYKLKDSVIIHNQPIIGDSNNISFTPANVCNQLEEGDEIRVDFNSVRFLITSKNDGILRGEVTSKGHVGSNKAVDINKHIKLPAITPKDIDAFNLGLKMGIKNYALSFTNTAKDVLSARDIIGHSNLISKIESIDGVLNLKEILPLVDQILIDRGDLSRQISIEKIPFIQRSIISYAKNFKTPVYVATNLLESMTNNEGPTRAEANDVASTLLMGASGLVLAAETAIGKYPVESVKTINSIIKEYGRWTPKTSLQEIVSFD